MDACRIPLRHTVSGKRRQKGMNWKRSERLNKRADGLSKIVAVRNVKREREEEGR